MRRHSPYNYAFNNPVFFMDPDGMAPVDVIITGSQSQEAFNQLQEAVSTELTLSIGDDGKVSYELMNPDNALSSDAQQLVNAIDDGSVVNIITAENSIMTSEGDLMIGGAFMGNEITIGGEHLSTVTTNQEVNPSVLGPASEVNGAPGADMLHEVTEAYQGGLISQKRNEGSGKANQEGSVYPKAHKRATPQSGKIYERIYDAKGNVMQKNSNGSYPSGVKRAEWYVKDSSGKETVIQNLGNR